MQRNLSTKWDRAVYFERTGRTEQRDWATSESRRSLYNKSDAYYAAPQPGMPKQHTRDIGTIVPCSWFPRLSSGCPLTAKQVDTTYMHSSGWAAGIYVSANIFIMNKALDAWRRWWYDIICSIGCVNQCRNMRKSLKNRMITFASKDGDSGCNRQCAAASIAKYCSELYMSWQALPVLPAPQSHGLDRFSVAKNHWLVKYIPGVLHTCAVLFPTPPPLMQLLHDVGKMDEGGAFDRTRAPMLAIEPFTHRPGRFWG